MTKLKIFYCLKGKNELISDVFTIRGVFIRGCLSANRALLSKPLVPHLMTLGHLFSNYWGLLVQYYVSDAVQSRITCAPVWLGTFPSWSILCMWSPSLVLSCYFYFLLSSYSIGLFVETIPSPPGLCYTRRVNYINDPSFEWLCFFVPIRKSSKIRFFSFFYVYDKYLFSPLYLKYF